MTARRIVALFAVAVLAFAVGSSAFRLAWRGGLASERLLAAGHSCNAQCAR